MLVFTSPKKERQLSFFLLYSLIFCICICICSCGNNKSGPDVTLGSAKNSTVHTLNSPSLVHLKEIYSFSAWPFEPHFSSMMANGETIFTSYTADRSVFIVDTTLKLKSEFISRGKGPGESIRLANIQVNADGFSVFDMALNRIDRYALQSNSTRIKHIMTTIVAQKEPISTVWQYGKHFYGVGALSKQIIQLYDSTGAIVPSAHFGHIFENFENNGVRHWSYSFLVGDFLVVCPFRFGYVYVFNLKLNEQPKIFSYGYFSEQTINDSDEDFRGFVPILGSKTDDKIAVPFIGLQSLDNLSFTEFLIFDAQNQEIRLHLSKRRLAFMFFNNNKLYATSAEEMNEVFRVDF